MPTDLPMAIMFLVFLSLFILVATSPVLHRLFALVGSLLSGSNRFLGQGEEKISEAHSWRDNALNDYEIILVRKLAMTGDRGLSRRMLINSLYFKPQSVDRALKSLSRRGLIRAKKTSFWGVRHCLSTNGQEYARQQDLMPRYQLQTKGKGILSLVR